ncbi:MAG: transaldolase [SAR202 cluster bacterium]|nr:transaldolase [SAR202 cluster bacterium]
MNNLQKLNALGQSAWYDNVRRGLIRSGELAALLKQGVTGLTSNPTIFEKAMAQSADYDDEMVKLARQGKSAGEIYEALAVEDIQAVADMLRGVYDATKGVDGYASLEVSPLLANDTEGTVAEAHRLFRALNRPNVMIKVPATPAGVPAIRRLIADGLNINVTLVFSLEAYSQVREAYIAGLEDLAKAGGNVSKAASVASFFVSRVDTLVDNSLKGKPEEKSLAGKAAIANAKLAYGDFQRDFGGKRFQALKAKGAHVQRPLWASTSTKNLAYRDVIYVDNLIGRDTVNTMPENTLKAFLDHGKPEVTVDRDTADAEKVFADLERAGIRMTQVTGKLLSDGVKAFADSFDQLMANIEQKRTKLLAQTRK